MELARAFVNAAPWAAKIASETLQNWLLAQFSAVQATVPELPHDAPGFVRYLAQRLPEASDPWLPLQRVRGAELYLAFGCVLGYEAALHRLDMDLLSKLRVQGAAPSQREEVVQLLRTRLLVAEPGALCKLAQYRGDGPLLAWLQLSATRIFIELSRKQPRAELQRRAFSDPDLVVDPELDFLKLRYAAHFQRALDRALAELSTSDAALLKLCYLNQTPPSALAAIYSVSTRTVQRRIADIRARILGSTRAHLQAELALEPSELDSLLALVQSRLHLSLRRLGENPRSTPR